MQIPHHSTFLIQPRETRIFVSSSPSPLVLASADPAHPARASAAVTTMPRPATRALRRVVMGDMGLLLEVGRRVLRSEEHTSELQSLMRIAYDVFCLTKKIVITQELNNN